MNIIEHIKSKIEEYKDYKNSRTSKALIVPNNKKRNLLKYMQAKNLGRKYSEALYKHFKIMNSVENYDLLINLFGKKNIEKALKNENDTTAQIADKLFEKPEDLEVFNEQQSDCNYTLEVMKNCIDFNKATGLDLSDINIGIKPENFRRRSLNNKTMIDILKENKVTKDVLKEIYGIYGKEIIACYNNDSYLRNKTVLKIDENTKNSLVELQDHITYYSENDFDLILQKYFNDEKLSKTQQCILMGLLEKETDLIGTYSIKNLREHSEYIKSEIKVGIFNNILLLDKKYTNDERKKIVTLSKVWKEEDLNRYNNLELLKSRLNSLPKDQNILEIIEKIDEILQKPLDDIIIKSNEVSSFMDSAFMEYEVENRNNIIEKVYNPEKVQEVIINDFSQMNSSAMLHFFDPYRTMSKFDKYIKDLEEKRSEELGKKFVFSEDEKESMLLQYQVKENHYITDYALDFKGVGQVGDFDAKYYTDTSNQLSTMITTPKNILEGRGIRGQVAIGFSKETLNPELIATISSTNINSNKGIDYVESDNQFKDFSVSYDELSGDKKSFKDNTEVVLFRNSYESSLKPSYVMYVGNDKLDSETEKANIENVKKQMSEVGLKVPLVIFDRYAIKENIKSSNLEQNKKEDKEER